MMTPPTSRGRSGAGIQPLAGMGSLMLANRAGGRRGRIDPGALGVFSPADDEGELVPSSDPRYVAAAVGRLADEATAGIEVMGASRPRRRSCRKDWSAVRTEDVRLLSLTSTITFL